MLVENNSVPSDRRVWGIATALVRAGYEVEVVCPVGSRENERASFEVRDGVRINRYRLAPAGGGISGYLREYATALWRTRRIVRRLVCERPFDVVQACNPPDFLLFAAWPARRKGAQIVFDHHDLTPELFLARFDGRHPLLHRLALAVERLCFAVARRRVRDQRVLLPDRANPRRKAARRGIRRPQRPRSPPLSPAARPVSQAWAPHLVGYVGVMAPQDGVDHALRALAVLAQRREDWHAIFAGDGESRAELMRLSSELGLSDRVEFVGWLEDEAMATLLCSSDVCLAPEPYTPLNDASTMIKIAEYMAMSRPVVAYELRESRFAAGDAAVYAEPNDVAAFAERIDDLLNDPHRRERMGRIGRERVERELSWEHSERNLTAAYSSAIERAGHGRAPRRRARSLWSRTGSRHRSRIPGALRRAR